jgi:hypothetical protein
MGKAQCVARMGQSEIRVNIEWHPGFRFAPSGLQIGNDQPAFCDKRIDLRIRKPGFAQNFLAVFAEARGILPD